MSLLEKWILRENFFKTENKKITHLKLNGGKLSVPENKLLKFQKLYAKDIENDIPHYLCEMKTSTYKLFIDVDLLDNEALTDSTILEYSRLIHTIVVHYYPHLRPYLIICTTTPKPVSINEYNYIKTGVHMIWPDIIVSYENISWLREVIIQYLTNKLGNRSLETWDKIIDETVYKQNGLRMIYSNKMAFCKTCKKSPSCSLCNKTGKYHEGRPYKPFKIIDCEFNELSCNFSILEAVQKTSIVVLDDQPISKFIHKHPEWLDKKIKFKHTKKELGTEDIKGSSALNFREKIDKSSEIFSSTQAFIRKTIPHYKNVELIDIHRCADGDYYVCRTNSSYCMNINREHNSNTIYFYIDKHSVYQKCFCSCDTLEGRKFGKCKSYLSSGYRLSKKLIKMLYPNSVIDPKHFCELNTTSDIKKDKVVYINNVQTYLNYLESVILNKKQTEI